MVFFLDIWHTCTEQIAVKMKAWFSMVSRDPAPGMAVSVLVAELWTFLPIFDSFVSNKAGSSFLSLELDAGVNWTIEHLDLM